jgi:hypothetical protein
LAFPIDICVDRTAYQQFVIIRIENCILRGVKVIFIITGLQANCIPLTFVLVRASQADDIIMDLGRDKFLALVVHHSVIDGKVAIKMVVLNKIL